MPFFLGVVPRGKKYAFLYTFSRLQVYFSILLTSLYFPASFFLKSFDTDFIQLLYNGRKLL